MLVGCVRMRHADTPKRSSVHTQQHTHRHKTTLAQTSGAAQLLAYMVAIDGRGGGGGGRGGMANVDH